MRTRLGFSLLLLSAPSLGLAWYAYGAWLAFTMPKVQLSELTPLPAQGAKTLPFFELMSPLPELAGAQALPKLEYKKGPPDRFLERISVLVEKDSQSPKERIIYFGRHSRNDLWGIRVLPEESAREAHYIELALRLSQGESVPSLEGLSGFLYKPFFLQEASALLRGVESVGIMDQAGTPAFLFRSALGDGARSRASALFIRRNSFYRVDFLGDRGFSLVDPELLFRKTFLTERRSDALEYIAKNLSEVRLEPDRKSNMRLADLTWPVLLLAAHMSVDPASLDSYFHFAGLNAMLYKSTATDANDLEVSDALRNNVLSSDLYARDIAPEAAKTAEISRFARLLTRNFDQ